MVEEEAAVPAAHLVVGDLVRVLDVVLLQDLDRLLEEIHVDPVWSGPVLGGDDVVGTRSAGHGLGSCFEFLREFNVVEKRPGIVVFAVPGAFEVAHGGKEVFEFAIADEGEEGCVYSWGGGVGGTVVVC